jgi:hypothetical protein
VVLSCCYHDVDMVMSCGRGPRLVVSCFHEVVMMFSWCCHGVVIMMLFWRCCDVVMLLSWCCHGVVVLLLWCCRGVVTVVLPWCCRVLLSDSCCCHGVVMMLSCCCHAVNFTDHVRGFFNFWVSQNKLHFINPCYGFYKKNRITKIDTATNM